jgi:hypothetical protein
MKYPPAPLTPFVASLLCIRRRTHIPIEHREPKYLNQLSANTTMACSLFPLSLHRFRPLACLFSTACSLFCKNTRGGGIPVRLVASRRESNKTPDVGDLPDTAGGNLDRLKALSPLPLITSLQPLHFHAITHSFAQRRPAKPCPLKRLRTLSITTGVYPLHCSEFSPNVCSGGQRCYLQ